MSAAIGVTSTFGLSAPTGCVVNESSLDHSIEIKTVKSQTGVTVVATPAKMKETKISIKGVGIPALTAVTANSSVATNTVVVTSISVEESNDDFPTFTIDAISYSNLV